jgi:NADH dehydrogenase [ubiquinone] flavoprotein 3, mitochondrial
MISRNFFRFYKTSSYEIRFIPKPWKMPKEDYVEPAQWTHKFPLPSQVRPRAFFDCNESTKLGVSDEVDKENTYKNPEYFSYHPLSFYNMEEDLNCKRCRLQPSPFIKTVNPTNEKCP